MPNQNQFNLPRKLIAEACPKSFCMQSSISIGPEEDFVSLLMP